MAMGYNPFFLNFGDNPLVPSQMMVDWMKTALEEAQANLNVAQIWAKSQVGCSRHYETLEVGDEVVLSMRNISVN